MRTASGPPGVPAASLAAAVVFVGTFVVLGELAPGYDARSEFVSELVSTPLAAYQRVSFVLTGTLVLVVAVGSHRTGAAHTGSVIAFGLVGAGLAGSAFFDADPSAVPHASTTHGILHSIIGAVVFAAMPVACFLVARSGRLRRASITVGVVLVGIIVALKLSQIPTSPLFPVRGLVQRLDLVVWFGWLAGYGMLARRPAGPPRAGPSAQRRRPVTRRST